MGVRAVPVCQLRRRLKRWVLRRHEATERPDRVGAGPDQIRCVNQANFGERSIRCVAEVPQGGLAWFMQGDLKSSIAAAEGACRDAMAGLDGSPIGLVAFDCAGRRRFLGDEGITEEVACMSRSAEGAPLSGFYTYGEIARTHGISGFHNQTIVVLALG